MVAFLAFIFGVISGIGGYFLIKSGTAANPNDWAQITPGILLVLICLVLVGVAVVEASE